MGFAKKMKKVKSALPLRRKSKALTAEDEIMSSSAPTLTRSSQQTYEFRVTANPIEYSEENKRHDDIILLSSFSSPKNSAAKSQGTVSTVASNTTQEDQDSLCDDDEPATQTVWRWLSLNSCLAPLLTTESDDNDNVNNSNSFTTDSSASAVNKEEEGGDCAPFPATPHSLGSGSSYYHSDGTGDSSQARACQLDTLLELPVTASNISEITTTPSVDDSEASSDEESMVDDDDDESRKD